jgi:hypothetical protein
MQGTNGPEPDPACPVVSNQILWVVKTRSNPERACDGTRNHQPLSHVGQHRANRLARWSTAAPRDRAQLPLDLGYSGGASLADQNLYVGSTVSLEIGAFALYSNTTGLVGSVRRLRIRGQADGIARSSFFASTREDGQFPHRRDPLLLRTQPRTARTEELAVP